MILYGENSDKLFVAITHESEDCSYRDAWESCVLPDDLFGPLQRVRENVLAVIQKMTGVDDKPLELGEFGFYFLGRAN